MADGRSSVAIDGMLDVPGTAGDEHRDGKHERWIREWLTTIQAKHGNRVPDVQRFQRATATRSARHRSACGPP
jgi:hypothetical protein